MRLTQRLVLFVLVALTSASPSPPLNQRPPNSLSKRLPNSIPADLSLFSSANPLFIRDDSQDSSSDDSEGDPACPQAGYHTCPSNKKFCCPRNYVCNFGTNPVSCDPPTLHNITQSGLSRGATIGIAVAGAIIGLGLIIGLTVFFCLCRAGGKWYNRRKAKKAGGVATSTSYAAVPTGNPQTVPLNQEAKAGYYVSEQTYHDAPHQHPYDPATAYNPQSQQPVQYPQHAPPPPTPGFYDPNQGYANAPASGPQPSTSPAPPYGQH